MQGVGWIFEQFRDGCLEDDDEVALVHGPAELGYAPITVPMVNVRANIERAIEEQVIEAATGLLLTTTAKNIFYQDRTWESVLSSVQAHDDSLSRFRDWVCEHQVDRKREDAESLLRVMQARLGEKHEPSFRFESNIYWDQVVSQTGLNELDTLVLDEARLNPKEWAAWCAAGVGRLSHQRRGEARPPRDLKTLLNNFRSVHGLGRRADLRAWCEANGLDELGLEELLLSEERLSGVCRANLTSLYPCVLDHTNYRTL